MEAAESLFSGPTERFLQDNFAAQVPARLFDPDLVAEYQAASIGDTELSGKVD